MIRVTKAAEKQMGGARYKGPMPKCGFRVFIYNAFTKSIRANQFTAVMKITDEVNGEEVETMRFLSLSKDKTTLSAKMPHGLKGEFEVELFVKFPEGDQVEVFNFAVDEHGKIS